MCAEDSRLGSLREAGSLKTGSRVRDCLVQTEAGASAVKTVGLGQQRRSSHVWGEGTVLTSGARPRRGAPWPHMWPLLPVREKILTVPWLLAASRVWALGRQQTAEMKPLSLCRGDEEGGWVRQRTCSSLVTDRVMSSGGTPRAMHAWG